MKKILFVFIMIFLLFFTGCGSEDTASSKLRIAEQYGIAYAPVQIMKHENLIEKYVPGIEIEWQQMANTAAIREGMVANQLDVGFMAIPPFLIGWDKGMDWRIFTGVSSVPVALVASEDVESIKDLSDTHRIALPQPGSVQHILLSMACEKLLGDSHKLDNNLVTLSHPDGMNALLTGNEITAHFTSTPYLEMELSHPGYHKILDGKQAFGGDFSFIVGVTTSSFHESKENYDGLNSALQDAINFINKNPEKAAEILTEYYDLSKDEIYGYITSDDVWYDTRVSGAGRFSEFMKGQGYLSKDFKDNNEIMWGNVNTNDE